MKDKCEGMLKCEPECDTLSHETPLVHEVLEGSDIADAITCCKGTDEEEEAECGGDGDE